MVSCSWSLNLALGFPQPMLQGAAFRKLVALQLQNSQLNLSLWLLITKLLKEKELLHLLAFGMLLGIRGAQSCYFIGDCSFFTEGRKPL